MAVSSILIRNGIGIFERVNELVKMWDQGTIKAPVGKMHVSSPSSNTRNVTCIRDVDVTITGFAKRFAKGPLFQDANVT